MVVLDMDAAATVEFAWVTSLGPVAALPWLLCIDCRDEILALSLAIFERERRTARARLLELLELWETDGVVVIPARVLRISSWNGRTSGEFQREGG